MRVREAQNLGALMILVASLVVYGGSLLIDRYPLPETSLPWGNQGPGMIAAEISGGRGADGVYFLPERMPIAMILKIIGMEEKIEPADESLSADTGYTICAEDGMLKISAMPTVRRLALGMPIDLNRASAEELSQVPGIGEKLAAQIVQLRQLRRQFESVSDLMAVQGIKEKKLNNLKKYLTVRPVP
jgi:competence ComEA-like helix-hairpin-helix protein